MLQTGWLLLRQDIRLREGHGSQYAMLELDFQNFGAA